MKNPAAGGGRWVDVAPERFVNWTAGFAERHGGLAVAASLDAARAVVTLTGHDGATAECHLPFPPLPGGDGPDLAADPGAIVAHALAERTVGVLLVRLGGYAAGVFTGAPPTRLDRWKTGSRPVHGRSAAGGWSQHRFARRREKQASEALAAAASAAVTILGPVGKLDAVVLGGDRRAMAGLSEDPRLAPYLARAAGRFLTVPDPKLAVLRETPRAFLALRVKLTEPV